jgi:MFS superfamily sulfate permease-like transporter
VIDFISVPVTAGFTSAAAITIASGQLKAKFN